MSPLLLKLDVFLLFNLMLIYINSDNIIPPACSCLSIIAMIEIKDLLAPPFSGLSSLDGKVA